MNTTKIIYGAVFCTAVLFAASCSQSAKEGHEGEAHQHESETDQESHGHDAESGESHHHDDEGEAATGESTIWTPSGQGTDVISSDFHFIAGGMEDIIPEVVAGPKGENLLALTANGKEVAFVFHKTYGNVGMAVSLNRTSFEGTIKLVHHARNNNDYEFVAINGNKMKLGRIVDGEETIFDESDFSGGDWITVRASAAGEHYKGYIGNKMVTHGHGDETEEGYVGIMTEGTGKIHIKSIEVSPLEAE